MGLGFWKESVAFRRVGIQPESCECGGEFEEEEGGKRKKGVKLTGLERNEIPEQSLCVLVISDNGRHRVMTISLPYEYMYNVIEILSFAEASVTKLKTKQQMVDLQVEISVLCIIIIIISLSGVVSMM